LPCSFRTANARRSSIASVATLTNQDCDDASLQIRPRLHGLLLRLLNLNRYALDMQPPPGVRVSRRVRFTFAGCFVASVPAFKFVLLFIASVPSGS
jgi:hypothetical protein